MKAAGSFETLALIYQTAGSFETLAHIYQTAGSFETLAHTYQTAGSFETLAHTYQTTHHSIPEDCEWDIHKHEVLKTDNNVTDGNQTQTLLVTLVCRHSHLQGKTLLLPFLIHVTHVYQFVLQLLHGPHLTCHTFSLH